MKRIASLDGMRGLAALYVVLHHAYFEVSEAAPKEWLVGRFAWLAFGHYAVAVFIVLSGFSLAAGDPMRGGFWAYVRRRARRILPPYYVALGLSLLLIWLVPGLQSRDDPRWGEIALPAFEAKTLVSHAFLIHNVRSSWCHRIDPPMWSVATEWQIYFLLPAILWVSRRWGMGAGVALAFVLGLAPVQFRQSTCDCACPWYAGLFAFGAAAAIGRHRRPSPRWLLPLTLPLCLFLADGLAVVDALVGAVTAAFLAQVAAGRAPDWLVTPLESRPAVVLGAFSYSLYLTHYPLQAWASAALVRLGLSPDVRLLILLGPVTLVCLAVAYGFHLVAERPFMPGHAGSLARGEVGDLESGFMGSGPVTGFRAVPCGNIGP